MDINYQDFLKNKQFNFNSIGIEIEDINPILFDYQKDIVRWALRKGRSAIFAECGMGKTLMQLEWANHIYKHTSKPILILAPLAVTNQTIIEAFEKLQLNIVYIKDQSEMINGINITNYERLNNLDLSQYIGVVLDESSIIKSFTGAIRTEILSGFKNTQFKLACTATPSPNDFMELGNHSEFVGCMSREEMLSMFFVHDGGETSKWKIKGHAKDDFWKWICEWAVMITKPSDLGYSDEGFELPPIYFHEHVCKVAQATSGYLFPMQASGLQERIKQRTVTVDIRSEKCAEIINNDNSNDSWLIWCDRNSESENIRKNSECIELKGSDKPEQKTSTILAFSDGRIQKLVTKPKIAGMGLNLQICHNMIFVGLSDSYESFYQAVRRCWRFGQKHPVHVHIVIAETEGNVLSNIQRKEQDMIIMRNAMLSNMSNIQNKQINSTKSDKTTYNPSKALQIPSFLGV